MKQFTITFESDEHCEEIAKKKGWLPTVPNPEYAAWTPTVPNPDFDEKDKESEETIPNPEPQPPATIPNPESPEDYLANMYMKGYKELLVTISNEKQKASLETAAAEFIAKGAIKSE